jgi:hypothetical protein
LDRLRAEEAERARKVAVLVEEAPVDIEKLAYTEHLTDKHHTVIKLRAQNDNLKSELKALS